LFLKENHAFKPVFNLPLEFACVRDGRKYEENYRPVLV